MEINPWASTQYEDYSRLRDEFGIAEFDPEVLPDPPALFRRRVVFGQRDYFRIADAVREERPWAILTGLMPSGRMHLGHKTLIDQVVYYQSVGAQIFLAVADIESFATRNMSFERGRDLAINEFIVNYVALGLEPSGCQIYFQSQRKDVVDLGLRLARRANLSQMRSIYGFSDDTNMTHVLSPIVQVGDIMHPQMEKYGGPRPVLVPVGVDQDPHIRLTRDLAAADRIYNVELTNDNRIGIFLKGKYNVKNTEDFLEVKRRLDLADNVVCQLFSSYGWEHDINPNHKYQAIYIELSRPPTNEDLHLVDDKIRELECNQNKTLNEEEDLNGNGFFLPSSSYHRFMTGLTGGKMSSSDEDSAIFLTDDPKAGAKKVMRAVTGGGTTVEEHRANGGDPGKCAVFELFVYHFIDSDEELERVRTECTSGERLCGQCKKQAAECVRGFLEDIRSRRDEARERLKDFNIEGM